MWFVSIMETLCSLWSTSWDQRKSWSKNSNWGRCKLRPKSSLLTKDNSGNVWGLAAKWASWAHSGAVPPAESAACCVTPLRDEWASECCLSVSRPLFILLDTGQSVLRLASWRHLLCANPVASGRSMLNDFAACCCGKRRGCCGVCTAFSFPVLLRKAERLMHVGSPHILLCKYQDYAWTFLWMLQAQLSKTSWLFVCVCVCFPLC